MTAHTIYALSTPPGRGGVAVVRVSGVDAFVSLQQLSPQLPPIRKAVLRRLGSIDQGMVIRFEGPASFTGEDVVEYHLHGGRAVVQSMLDFLAAQKNHRMALPGEFTRRAFENGKLDLTEAEAIADLIHAETEAQKNQALSQLEGHLGRVYAAWKDRLARLLAYLEADLDFSDQDLPEDVIVKVKPDLSGLIAEIRAHLSDNRRGERLRDGFRIVILGAPNAGKSTLTNALAQRDVAIVSPIAGTTRDVIEAHLDVGGYPVIVADTAGLRPEQLSQTGHDGIESEGIRRALERAQNADIKILLFDATSHAPDAHTLALIDETAILVANKADLTTKPPMIGADQPIAVSASTGQGIDILLQHIAQRLKALAGPTQTPALTRARHRDALERAVAALERSGQAPLPELLAEDLRLAIRHIGSITGHVDVEDLLDIIFRDFCIGK